MMTRANKNEAVAALHRERILSSSNELFIAKGYDKSTIDDISKASGYSRRTLYAYFSSKEDILHNIIANGLSGLKDEIESALDATEDFVSRFRGVFHAMHRYYLTQPLSAKKINSYSSVPGSSQLSDAACRIFAFGSEINTLLSAFVEEGITQGIVCRGINPLLSVQIFWSSASALFELLDAKSGYLTQTFGMPEDELLEYGFRQLANSILEEKIIK